MEKRLQKLQGALGAVCLMGLVACGTSLDPCREGKLTRECLFWGCVESSLDGCLESYPPPASFEEPIDCWDGTTDCTEAFDCTYEIVETICGGLLSGGEARNEGVR